MLAIAQQAPVPTRVRGAIESVDADTMTVKARSGEIFKLRMASDLRVSGVVKAELSDIKLGSFIGATTVPGPDGAPKAVEIHIFPEDMRGTGEGSRAWDLKPNSSMTNATVSESSVSTDGHTLLVKYKGGEKRVDITPETPIVTFVPGDKSELKAGAKVMATIKQLPDGSFETSRVSVGRDGLTPPM
ncbi:hypothetical protein ACQR16_28585 [Bradyrhizobium oligotrophicum]|uniref:hypothetical protein n=1 Tax=Bradyrhizobium oligotrophicum TaxID=44255 RepID=UPI003EBD4B68